MAPSRRPVSFKCPCYDRAYIFSQPATNRPKQKGESSMETRRPSKDRFYRPELDVVRFIAFSLVFLFHALPHVPGPRAASALKNLIPIFYALSSACRFGLTLFFTLSAFLICELLIREREAAGTVLCQAVLHSTHPAHLAPLLLRFGPRPARCLPSRSDRGAIVYIGWSTLFMGAWYSIVHGPVGNPMGPLWSISVEEQFYLFAPGSSSTSVEGRCMASAWPCSLLPTA